MAVPHSVDILIIGAGPTGLGAATRLADLGARNWALVEGEAEPGGLACTASTPEGFLFDMGGHVIFSHYSFFDKLLDRAVGSGADHWTIHQRVSYIWLKDRWIPYPFQNNLHCLAVEDQITCVNGLIDAQAIRESPRNFDEWILKNMGTGIADLFMRPYNEKVWACAPKDMHWQWLGERVATVDLKKVIQRILMHAEPHIRWGPNATFRFPKLGGTGAIWKSVSSLLPRESVFFGKHLVGVDFENQIAKFSDGSVCQYRKMISTIPLDITLALTGSRAHLTKHLKHSSTHVVGLGIRGASLHDKKCWMYFPESNCQFYRCTVFSLYSEFNCPSETVLLPTLRIADATSNASHEAKPGPYWSLMFEVSESLEKPVDISRIVEDTIQGAIATKLIRPESEIVSVFHRKLERGYPIPSLSRDEAVDEGLRFLKSMNVWSRGRFGAWKYEVGNQDHSVMQGVEAVDNIIQGSPEQTVENPESVNGRKNNH